MESRMYKYSLEGDDLLQNSVNYVLPGDDQRCSM
jgi:hypothetical protein